MDEPAIYEIDLTKKYILQFERSIPMAEVAQINAKIQRWVNGSDPFLILSGDIKLVKVETDDE